MATYTSNIRLVQQSTGDNDSTWGVVLNDGMISLTDIAIAGYTTISLAGGDVSLTANNGSDDESRYAMLELTGTLTGNTGVYLPSNATKSYIVKNATTGSFDVTVLITGGTGSIITQGSSSLIYTDGTTVTPAVDSSSLNLGTAADLNFGTSVNELIPVSSADARYVGVSNSQTITGTKTFSSDLVVNSTATSFGGSSVAFNSVVVEGSATQAYSKPVSVAVASLAVAIDFASGNNFTTTLDGNVSISHPSNPQPGQSGIIYVVQDGTGSRTVTFGTDWKFVDGAAPTFTTSANAVDALIYNIRTSSAITTFFVSNIS